MFFWAAVLFEQTSIAPSQCRQQKNSTQSDVIISQRHSWWDPIALCAERVRELGPQQHTQEPTQASVTAEGFVVVG